jgi:hypothetical protein
MNLEVLSRGPRVRRGRCKWARGIQVTAGDEPIRPTQPNATRVPRGRAPGFRGTTGSAVSSARGGDGAVVRGGDQPRQRARTHPQLPGSGLHCSHFRST